MKYWKQTFLIFLLFLQITPATADTRYDKYRIHCTNDQSKVVKAALNLAKSMIRKSIASLPPKNSAEGKTFQKWFGGPEGDKSNEVKKVYEQILPFADLKQYWCPNASFPDSDSGTYAFVLRGSVLEIFLENQFFKTGNSGFDSKAGTLLHEFTHQVTNLTNDHAYGTSNAKSLAKNNKKAARNNADNFQYYSEEVAK